MPRELVIHEFRSTYQPKRTVRLVNQGIRDSIISRACVFGRTCRQIASEIGLEAWEIEELLKQELEKRIGLAYRRGVREGKLGAFPPPAKAA